MGQCSVKHTLFFTAALATSVSLFAFGAAQASGRSGKGLLLNAYGFSLSKRRILLTPYCERNVYREQNNARAGEARGDGTGNGCRDD